MHWGEEYGLVTQRQKTLAAALAHAGASLIVGSGPHVLQGHQRLAPQGSDHETLVLYSLGNFLFDSPYPKGQLGAIVNVRLKTNSIDSAWEACAVPTQSRRGLLSWPNAEDQKKALRVLGLPAC